MILRDYECNKCQTQFEDAPTEAEPAKCPKCESLEVQEKYAFGGYKIHGDNGASVTPRHSGFFKRRR